MAPKAPQDHQTKSSGRRRPPIALVEIASDQADVDQVDNVPLFSLDGRVYSIPGKVRASAALRMLDDASRMSEEAAAVKAMREVLGEKAWHALAHSPVSQSQLMTILETFQQIILGSLEDEEGN